MLEQVLMHLRNFFVVPGGVHFGTFTVEDGGIDLPFLQEGQYFRIVGSVFNDGVYIYPSSVLKDERFKGAVWAMAVPSGVLDLVNDIEAWNAKNGSVVNGPYQSESFGGYSYTLKSGNNGGGSWQNVFANRLNVWRKI